MGGITLNTWVAALFYEPVENHMKRVPKDSIVKQQLDDFNDVIDEEDEGITLEFSKQVSNETVETNSNAISKNADQSQTLSKSQIPNATRDSFVISVENVKGQNDEQQRKISRPFKNSHVPKNESFINQLNSNTSLYASTPRSRLNQHRAVSRPPKRSSSTSSFQYVSTPYHGSTLSFQPEEFASHISLKSLASSINPIAACAKQKKMKSKFLDLTLLKDPVYLVILISNSTNAIGYTNFIILLPAFAQSLGFDKNLSAYLLSIVSAFDLVGRIGGSALSDWTTFIPKTW